MRALLFVVMSVGLLANAACGSVSVPGASQANPLDAEENQAVVDINMFRTQNMLGTLTVCTVLNTVASAHSDDMRDNGYLDDNSQDGTTPRQRACAAGFMPACSMSTSYAELVASGNATGDGATMQWEMDSTTMPILLNDSPPPGFVVLGVGRSIGGDQPLWSVDMASATDPSCN